MSLMISGTWCLSARLLRAFVLQGGNYLQLIGHEVLHVAAGSEASLKGVFWFILDCLGEVEELANVNRSLNVDSSLPVEHDSYD